MTDSWEPDWVAPRPGFLAVADDLKDEFHERVFQHLQDAHDWGHSSRTIQPPGNSDARVHELIANTATGYHDTRLWVMNVDGGLFTWTTGKGEIDVSECELWEEATTAALARLGERTPVVWRAYLAQAPASPPFMRFRLEEPIQLDDGATLAPRSGVISTDAMTMVGQAMAGPHASSLIQVDGATPCYAWHGDGQTSTLRRLRLVSAVVSFAWDCPWFLRDGPSDRIDATWAGAPGPVSGQHYGWSTSTEQPLEPPEAQLPSWVPAIDAALTAQAKQDSPLHRAFLMHHEALLVMREHPSLGLLSFVASIETLAAMTETLERCAECKVVIGSTARFKRAIETVVSDAEAHYLAKAYDRRSRTVHDSWLHGREYVGGGWGEMSLYRGDSAFYFEVGVVRTAQQASRALLWRALGINGAPTDPLHSDG